MGDDEYSKKPQIVVIEIDGTQRILDENNPDDRKLIFKQLGLRLATGDKSGGTKALGGAIEKIKNEFKTESRTSVIMACGTGKTDVGYWIYKYYKPKTTLVLVPSIALVKQIRSDWLSQITDEVMTFQGFRKIGKHFCISDLCRESCDRK